MATVSTVILLLEAKSRAAIGIRIAVVVVGSASWWVGAVVAQAATARSIGALATTTVLSISADVAIDVAGDRAERLTAHELVVEDLIAAVELLLEEHMVEGLETDHRIGARQITTGARVGQPSEVALVDQVVAVLGLHVNIVRVRIHIDLLECVEQLEDERTELIGSIQNTFASIGVVLPPDGMGAVDRDDDIRLIILPRSLERVQKGSDDGNAVTSRIIYSLTGNRRDCERQSQSNQKSLHLLFCCCC